MGKGRMEAFTDGVLAVIITILVLEMKVPHDADPAALAPLVPVFLSYVLSFVMIGIYWNNHHHMFHAVQRCSGATLWANLHLLFWLSLVPFVTGWMDENHFAPLTVAAYGTVLLCAAIAYTILTRVLLEAARPRLDARQGAGARLQGLDLARDLPRRDPARLLLSVRLVRDVCRGGGDLALPRPALREADRRSTLAWAAVD